MEVGGNTLYVEADLDVTMDFAPEPVSVTFGLTADKRHKRLFGLISFYDIYHDYGNRATPYMATGDVKILDFGSASFTTGVYMYDWFAVACQGAYTSPCLVNPTLGGTLPFTVVGIQAPGDPVRPVNNEDGTVGVETTTEGVPPIGSGIHP
ncbi:MAG: hypothetical protein QOK43_2110 [Acidimicrobiaceae bacterium]|nr:hypothetical protein [Acidimicrobiaceae bacterium]